MIERMVSDEVDVEDDSTSVGPSDTYISVADVRAAGMTSNPPDDATIHSSIVLWQQVIERATRQWFRPIATEFYLDGNNTDTLHLGVPIISLSELRLNGADTPLDTKRYRVYSGGRMPDHRGNPRIRLVDDFGYGRDIFTGSDVTSRNRFLGGRGNQYIRGVFGYVEPDGSTPAPIKRALLKLVLRDLSRPLVGDASGGIAPPPIMSGIVQEEVTDGHSIKYAVSGGGVRARAPGLAGLIDDPEVQMILRLYRAPIALSTTSNPTWT